MNGRKKDAERRKDVNVEEGQVAVRLVLADRRRVLIDTTSLFFSSKLSQLLATPPGEIYPHHANISCTRTPILSLGFFVCDVTALPNIRPPPPSLLCCTVHVRGQCLSWHVKKNFVSFISSRKYIISWCYKTQKEESVPGDNSKTNEIWKKSVLKINRINKL